MNIYDKFFDEYFRGDPHAPQEGYVVGLPLFIALMLAWFGLCCLVVWVLS